MSEAPTPNIPEMNEDVRSRQNDRFQTWWSEGSSPLFKMYEGLRQIDGGKDFVPAISIHVRTTGLNITSRITAASQSDLQWIGESFEKGTDGTKSGLSSITMEVTRIESDNES